MKTGKRVLLCLLLWAGPFFSIAQCVTPLETISFDSTITGAGNAFHTFTFPKFDPALGTLVEVVIRAEVTLRYRFQLENRETIPINNYRVRVVREDEISGSTIPIPITNAYQTTYGPYSLAPNDGANGSGPDYISIGPVYAMNHQVVERRLTNTADYLGNGNVSMDYSANTYSIVFGSVNYSFNGTAEDTARMTVTYRYCSTWFLPVRPATQTTVAKKTKSDIVLYPNPSNGNFNIVFHNTKRNDWAVDVLTLSGQILKQYAFNRVLTARINLSQDLSKGSYFVRITNRKTGEQSMHPMLVR